MTIDENIIPDSTDSTDSTERSTDGAILFGPRADLANPDWRDQANCKGRLELFFAPKAERPEARARREAKAKRLCDACDVSIECRDFARRNREYGYWAGESEEDRHILGFRVTAPIGVRTRLAREAAQKRSA